MTQQSSLDRPNEPENGESVLVHLLKLIRQRQYGPGERIPSERELAAKFSVSRAVIREELSVLESMRVVERRPQSGVFVREIAREGSLDALVLEADMGLPMTVEEIRSLNEFRAILEVQSVILACQRRTEDDIKRLELILAETGVLLDQGRSISDMDAQFHLAICAATQNHVLTRAANSFWLASKKRRDAYHADLTIGRRSLEDHRRLLDAVIRRDVAAASAVMDGHLGRVEEFWVAAINGTGADESTKGARDSSRLSPD